MGKALGLGSSSIFSMVGHTTAAGRKVMLMDIHISSALLYTYVELSQLALCIQKLQTLLNIAEPAYFCLVSKYNQFLASIVLICFK